MTPPLPKREIAQERPGVVGAFTGALHGRPAVRQKWLDGISSSSLGDPRGATDRALIERLSRHAARSRRTSSPARSRG